MAVLGVKVWNYKKHKNLELKLNGRNTFFVGDIAAGKSCILDLIQSANMQKEFPTDPLTTGEEAGGVEIQEELDGKEYTIKRTFTGKDNGRWIVTAKNGDKPPSLTALLDRILSKTLKNGFFDYTTYFFELKSPQARADYIIKSCGGEEVADNLKTISEKAKKRRVVGSERTQQKAVYEQLGEINKSELIEKSKLYEKEKTQDEADEVYNKIMETMEDGENNLAELQQVRIQLHQKTANNSRLIDIELQLKALQEEKKKLEAENKKNTATVEKEKELEEKRYKIVEVNTKIEAEADLAHKNAINEIIKFNGERQQFITSVKALREFNRLDKEWEIIDNEITELENKNKELFLSKLPIPEIGLTTKETEKETINVVTYKGREFSFENLSKGESIIIAAQIQNALNPGGNNFIVIPEANLLGSKLDDILEECKKFKIQALVEVTQRKQEFKIIFEEEFMKP